MKKNLRYLLAIAVLLALNLYLFLNGADSTASSSSKFFQEELLDKVELIQFDLPSNSIELRKTSDGWLLNDQFNADEGFISTLINILKRVESGRELGIWDQQVLGEIRLGDAYAFQIASNPTKTRSFFIQDGEAYEVSVPGYRDNVVDLFLMHPDQWRDRLVFDGNWRTIQRAEVVFTDDREDFNIVFADKFFLVNQQQPTDSSSVIDYLSQYEYFQANEMISDGRFPNFDSLALQEPLASIVLEDIKLEQPVRLSIFPALSGQRFHLVVMDGSQKMVVGAARIGGLLDKPD